MLQRLKKFNKTITFLLRKAKNRLKYICTYMLVITNFKSFLGELLLRILDFMQY